MAQYPDAYTKAYMDRNACIHIHTSTRAYVMHAYTYMHVCIRIMSSDSLMQGHSHDHGHGIFLLTITSKIPTAPPAPYGAGVQRGSGYGSPLAATAGAPDYGKKKPQRIERIERIERC